MKRSFGKEVVRFATQMDALEATYPLIMKALIRNTRETDASMNRYLKKHGIEVPTISGQSEPRDTAVASGQSEPRDTVVGIEHKPLINVQAP